MKNVSTAKLVRAALVAALYLTLNVVFAAISFGPVQLRVSESLCILILFFPESAIGLTVGCFFSNLLFSTPLDICLGTLATGIAALAAVFFSKRISRPISRFLICSAFPVITNAMLIPLTFMVTTFLWEAYFLDALSVAAGEILAVYLVGGILYFSLQKISAIKR